METELGDTAGRAELLEVDSLTVQYPSRRGGPPLRAVDGVSFCIRRASTVGLVGESGSGKSSTGRAILGLAKATHGTVLFQGRDITRMTGRRRARMGISIQTIAQDPNSALNPSRTIGDSLTEIPRFVNGENRAAALGSAIDMLERVGLDGSALGRVPGRFSGGQKQRIAIARALLAKPDLIVCDEPVSALDLSVQAQVLNLFKQLQQDLGIAYLFIGHDLPVVRFLADHIVVLYRGCAVENGPSEKVCSTPRHPYTKALLAAGLGSGDDLDALRPKETSHNDGENRGSTSPIESDTRKETVCPFLDRCPNAIEVCYTAPPPLTHPEDRVTVACHLWDCDGDARRDAHPRHRKVAGSGGPSARNSQRVVSRPAEHVSPELRGMPRQSN